MFYYSHNINDYRAATAHLTNGEDLAYRRLLDLYYEKEGPLVGDPAKLARLVRSSQVDVETVLAEFFTLVEGVYRQARCDFELAGMIDRAEKARANGKLGGRRRKEPSGLPSGYHPATESEPRANPEPSYPNTPVPQHPSTPEKKEPRKRVFLVEVEKPADVISEVWDAWIAVRKRKSAPLTKVAWEGVLRETAKAGWHINEVVRKMAERNWQAVESGWLTKEQSATGPAAKQVNANGRVLVTASKMHIPNMPIGHDSCECDGCCSWRLNRMTGSLADKMQTGTYVRSPHVDRSTNEVAP